MQTFLPYPSGRKSAKVLDNRRLGKQRVECLQILALLTDTYKVQTSPKDLGIDYGAVSLTPRCFCTHDGQVWAWNPARSGGGWMNHPAVRMWRGHTMALAEYSLNICAEWIWRGYRDTTAQTISLMVDLAFAIDQSLTPDKPPWWGDEAFHTSHQSNLLRKDPGYYGQYFPTIPDDLPYIWPK